MLSGKTVFVSGGTGFIGRAICKLASEYGAKIIFSYYKDEESSKDLIRTIPGAMALKIDLRNVDDIRKQLKGILKNNDVDILVNNAGVSQIMPFSLLEEEDVNNLLDINVKGTIFLTKEILRNMIRRKCGSIINIGSIAGHRMYEVPVHYAVSKAAIQGFTFSLASEVRNYNIRVNSVIPGLIEGGISKGIPSEQREDFISHCAVGRAGTPEEVAEVVCFIASDKASYVNGQNILVDGGI